MVLMDFDVLQDLWDFPYSTHFFLYLHGIYLVLRSSHNCFQAESIRIDRL